VSEFNWSEPIAQAQNTKIQDALKQQEEIRQAEEKYASEQQILRRMDAVVNSFLWAASEQGWPGVEHEFKKVATPQRFWRDLTEQQYVGAHYTSRYFTSNSIINEKAAIRINVNGSWLWREGEAHYGNYDNTAYLTCANNGGALTCDNRTYDIKLHPEETPRKVMSVLAQIAVDNAIVL
jgi:hypothetical protein